MVSVAVPHFCTIHMRIRSDHAHDKHLVVRIIKSCTDCRKDGNETKCHLKQNVFGQKFLLY